MLVLGIDPGLTRCGVGVVTGDVGRPLSLVDVGVLKSPADAPLADRLLLIDQQIGAWLDRHTPDAVAVERVFSQHNVRTVMGTAQVSGLALVAAARRGIPVATYTPSEMKAAVTGSGRADKQQVGAMVTRLLRLPHKPTPADAADALGLAICHVWRGGAQARFQNAVRRHTAAAAAPGGPRTPVSPGTQAARGAAVATRRSST